MALVGYIGRIWPTIANVNAMRHNLPDVIHHAPELLFSGKVSRIFPQATVLQCAPEPPVILAAFCVVCNPCRAASHGPECRESDARRLHTKVAGWNIDFMISTSPGSGQLIYRRHGIGFVGRSIRSLEDANWRQWRRILIPRHDKTFAACEER